MKFKGTGQRSCPRAKHLREFEGRSRGCALSRCTSDECFWRRRYEILRCATTLQYPADVLADLFQQARQKWNFAATGARFYASRPPSRRPDPLPRPLSSARRATANGESYFDTFLSQVTILINNAGVASGMKFLDTPDKLIIRTMDVNVMSHFWVRSHLPSASSSS